MNASAHRWARINRLANWTVALAAGFALLVGGAMLAGRIFDPPLKPSSTCADWRSASRATREDYARNESADRSHEAVFALAVRVDVVCDELAGNTELRELR